MKLKAKDKPGKQRGSQSIADNL